MTEWTRAASSWASQVPIDLVWNFLSRSFLLFMFPLLWRGVKSKNEGPLEREHLPGLYTTLMGNYLEPKITEAWNEELKKSKPKLSRAIWRSSKGLIISGTFCSALQGVLSAVGRPLVLRFLVLGLQRGMGIGEAVGLVMFFGVVAFFEGWIGVLGRQLLAEQLGTAYTQSLSQLLMNKVGELDIEAFQEQVKNESLNVDAARAGAKVTEVASKSTFGNGKEISSMKKNQQEEDGTGVDVDNVLVNDPQDDQIVADARDEIRKEEQKKRKRFRFWRSGKKNPSSSNHAKAVAETALLGNDFVRSYENLRSAASLPMAIASVIGGVIILLITVGSSSLTGLGIMVFILLANVFLSRISFHLEKKNMRMADERLQIVSSILESVRAVKLFGWEERFLQRVEKIRDREVIGIAKYRMTHVTNIVMGRASPVLSSMVTLIVFALGSSEGSLNMANAFVTVSVFQSLRLALIMIPLATQSLMAVSVNLGRMEKYLLAPSVPKRDVLSDDDVKPDVSDTDQPKLLLKMSDANITFASASPPVPVLYSLSCEVKQGEIVALCGPVGSGKTTFLRGALQLLRPTSGSYHIVDHVGYVPQRALVIGGTLKDNILLGRPFDQDKFNEAVTKSQLKRDIEMFPDRELAEVGERGTTLSGGQMQRLSFARALYSRPPLLLLDDPFSAVDPKVCRAMFDNCITKEAHGPAKTGVLLVMNQLSYLPQCDRILFLKDKRIHAEGAFNELRTNPEFEAFVESFTDEEGSGPIEEPPVVIMEPKTADGDQNSKDPSKTQAESILQTEARSTGAVGKDVYGSYLRAFGPFFVLLCLLTVAGGYSVMTVNDFWLSRWAAAESHRNSNTPPSTWYASIFAALSCAFGVLILCGSFMISLGGVRASKKLHNEIIRKVLWAPMSWFESNPTGRVMSRFAGDIARVDLYLSLTIDNALQLVVQLLATIIVVCAVVSYYLVPICVIALITFALLLRAVDRTLRETRRLANAAMSPVLSNIAETAVGLREVAKAFGQKEYDDIFAFFRTRHLISFDEYARANYFSGTLVNFSFLSAHLIAFFIAVAAACLMVALKDTYDQSLLGIALTYALVIPYLSSQSAQSITNMNMSFTSLERLLEYKRLPQEAPHSLPSDPSEGHWPSHGTIEFVNVEARYRPGLPLCLKGCSFTVRGGESIGIVGRTGSGKSSLIAVLFRLIEPCGGQILIDGVDLATIGLDALRSRITIIPQEPILMSGTVRYNLDPFSEFDDVLLNESLQRVGLGKIALTDVIEAKGSNISAGERQLLCFARALVLKSHRIVVMDEPSSSLDMKTDEAIVKMVQDELRLKRKCTILTVAHRVETIIGADRILVMRDGMVLEFDKPRKLLRKNDSEFASLVNSLGNNASSRLLHLADTSVSNLARSKSDDSVA